MKFRIETRPYETTRTVGGVTEPVTSTRRVAVPVLPRDWDAVAVKAVVALVLVLTLISITWSTVSIGHLLRGTLAAYLAGAVFDLAWAADLGMAYIVRFQPDRRRVVDRVGWALLAITVAAIVLEGLRTGGVAVAVIGSTVSIVAKTLWWTLNRAIRPDLSSEDAQWVSQQISQASAELAVSAVRRQVARVEDQATAQLLALEASRRPPVGAELLGRMPEEAQASAVPSARPVASPVPPMHATVEVDESRPLTAQEALTPPSVPAVENRQPVAALEESFAAMVPAPLGPNPSKEDLAEVQREWIRREVASGRSLSEPGFTARAAEALSVSTRTIDNRKREVREELARAAQELDG
ncbi:hypothetical protein [Frankia sp. AgW1.1]|uniref:hypothetical protein n=1 Tax=Frankia sp. AgW1.1 TaxID=1836971 RepID=UPI001934A600|nr:hypothetical protein [Frankia sp. AgW1.1]MBL7487059.1 hypothetical protein [Frankia sp. AgW1.1]